MGTLDRAAPVGITMAVALVGCADVLGIQPFQTETLDSAAGSSDASLGGRDAPAPTRDGTVADSEASSETDAGGLDVDAGGSACTAGGPCNAGDCQSGQWSCSDAGPVCTPTGAIEAGTSCMPASSDGGTFVCSGTACVACAAGEDCSSPDAGSCQKRTFDCSSGTAQCAAAGTLPEGQSCGGTNYCYGGVCSACKSMAPCSPTGTGSNSCHVGTTSCTNGVATCVEQNTAAAAGVACATTTGASGVCDGNSTCVACSQGGTCVPGGNTCKSGTMSCSGGYTCTPGSNINQGKTCGSGAICSTGSCVACNATSCANGCCDSNGCVTAQSISECGTGAGGGACRACTAPTGGTATCSANNCGGQCPAGSHLCGATCASNASPSTCGGACSPCSATNVATAGCSGTACTIASCTASFADCNGTFSDGCETSLTTNSNCGSCGHTCTQGQTCQSGTCQCPGGGTACNGVCTSTATDAANCGACGHSCVYGKCSGSTCQPWTVAPTSGAAVIACDGTNLVWLDSSNKVQQVPAAGGSTVPTLLATMASSYTPERIVMANQTVAWTTRDSSSQINIWMATESTAGSGNSGPANTVGTSGDPNVPVGLAISPSGGVAYFEFYDDANGSASLEACNLNLSDPACSSLATPASSIFLDEVAASSTYLFWTQEASSSVVRYTFADSTATNEASGQNSPALLALDSSFAYWASRPATPSTFMIYRGSQASPSPTAAQQVLASTSGTVNAIATDGKYVYYGGIFGTTKVGYVPVAGGAGQVLYTGVSGGSVGIGALVAVGGAVYFYDSSDNTIHGVAAPP